MAQIGALTGGASHCRPVICLSDCRSGEDQNNALERYCAAVIFEPPLTSGGCRDLSERAVLGSTTCAHWRPATVVRARESQVRRPAQSRDVQLIAGGVVVERKGTRPPSVSRQQRGCSKSGRCRHGMFCRLSPHGRVKGVVAPLSRFYADQSRRHIARGMLLFLNIPSQLQYSISRSLYTTSQSRRHPLRKLLPDSACGVFS